MIRAITPFLATAPYDEGSKAGGASVVDVRALLDKAGNAPELIHAKIKEGAALLKDGKRVIVCCDYGMSRSNAVAAGILSETEKISVPEAIRRVIRATGETEIKFEMIQAVAGAIDEGQEKPKTKKLLVTGATGDIGTYVLPLLQKSFPARGLSSGDIDLRAGTQELGLLCLEEQPTHILHLAAPRVISTNRGVGDEITMLKNAADVAKALGIRIIYLSSVQVFAGAAGDDPVFADETHPVAPANHLGHAKALGEKLLADMRANACILRVGQVYGPTLRKPRFLAYFTDRLRQHLPVVTHSFENGPPIVDLLHADDLAVALALAITKDFTGLHHVGRGEAIYPKAIAAILKNELNSVSPVESQAMEGRGNVTVLDDRTFFPAVSLQQGLTDMLKRSPR